jgi:hypothetical protein
MFCALLHDQDSLERVAEGVKPERFEIAAATVAFGDRLVLDADFFHDRFKLRRKSPAGVGDWPANFGASGLRRYRFPIALDVRTIAEACSPVNGDLDSPGSCGCPLPSPGS